MQSRKDRTVERYMRAGAAMRLFKTVYDQVCSDTEDRMFLEHPDLSNEYLDVFYGVVSNDTRTDVDRKVVKMAQEMTEQLFEGGRK